MVSGVFRGEIDWEITDWEIANCRLQIHCVAAFGGGKLQIAGLKIGRLKIANWEIAKL